MREWTEGKAKEKVELAGEKISDCIKFAKGAKPEARQPSGKEWLFCPEQSGQKFKTLF